MELRMRQARRASGVPDPELVEQAKRRTFAAKCKLEILSSPDPPIECQVM